MKLAAALILTLAAATAHADPKPAERAAALVDGQVKAYDAGDAEALAKTFGDAVVVTERDSAVTGVEALTSELDQVGGAMSPTPINRVGTAKKKKVYAGGNAGAVWINAELTLSGHTDCEGCGYASSSKYKSPLRITELYVDDGGTWKVVAANIAYNFGEPYSSQPNTEIPSPTEAGPLTALLTDPTALAAALAPDATVVWGTNLKEVGAGQAGGRKLLKKWKKLKMAIDGKVREVTGKTWGFVQANVDLEIGKKAPVRMRALLIAVPTDAGGWSVVSVHYSVR